MILAGFADPFYRNTTVSCSPSLFCSAVSPIKQPTPWCKPLPNTLKMGKTTIAKKPAMQQVKKGGVPIKKDHAAPTTSKPSRSTWRLRRIQCGTIEKGLAQEISAWVCGLASMPRTVSAICPLCAKKFRRRRYAQTHGASHLSGKLSFNMQTSKYGEHHKVQMEVIRALYDHDIMCGVQRGQYGERSSSLLMSWLQPDSDVQGGGSQSLYTLLGHHSSGVALVLTGDGPQYWAKGKVAKSKARAFGANQYYTMEFANQFAQLLVQMGGSYSPAMRALRTKLMDAGCETAALLQRQSVSICDLVCDIAESKELSNTLDNIRERLFVKGEYQSISIDATYKVAMKVH